MKTKIVEKKKKTLKLAALLQHILETVVQNLVEMIVVNIRRTMWHEEGDASTTLELLLQLLHYCREVEEAQYVRAKASKK